MHASWAKSNAREQPETRSPPERRFLAKQNWPAYVDRQTFARNARVPLSTKQTSTEEFSKSPAIDGCAETSEAISNDILSVGTEQNRGCATPSNYISQKPGRRPGRLNHTHRNVPASVPSTPSVTPTSELGVRTSLKSRKVSIGSTTRIAPNISRQ